MGSSTAFPFSVEASVVAYPQDQEVLSHVQDVPKGIAVTAGTLVNPDAGSAYAAATGTAAVSSES